MPVAALVVLVTTSAVPLLILSAAGVPELAKLKLEPLEGVKLICPLLLVIFAAVAPVPSVVTVRGPVTTKLPAHPVIVPAPMLTGEPACRLVIEALAFVVRAFVNTSSLLPPVEDTLAPAAKNTPEPPPS